MASLREGSRGSLDEHMIAYGKAVEPLFDGGDRSGRSFHNRRLLRLLDSQVSQETGYCSKGKEGNAGTHSV